jgi:hypothetical protein
MNCPSLAARPMLRHSSIHVQAMCAGCHHFPCFQLTEQVPVYRPCPCPWACSSATGVQSPKTVDCPGQAPTHPPHLQPLPQSTPIPSDKSLVFQDSVVSENLLCSPQIGAVTARSQSVGNGDHQHTTQPFRRSQPSPAISAHPSMAAMHVFVPGHARLSTSVRVAR